ncbi:hypothetical protein THASP1DRAFT_25369 [Thamnocephalis sphaerospora]|uniref:Uncharacterized protein n=1 Tax=Thamnocephalis sphaerospora TaxID=78915 RepID=A0A4P9XKF3_9FUNG|nr:hypothetical protein THASP1DRAFT_25369 [Thamnocephalis sphaerospora]|eukprot:RKP06278.1 hypothetical protein THASP1DRAFT_25369 [Thamnocephalis sphaerospora]
MIIFLTTILHLVVFALFALAFLANGIITRAKSYWFLLAICLLQCGADIALMVWPGDFNVDTIATSNFIMLVALICITLVSTRLMHIWQVTWALAGALSSSVKVVIPNYPHRFVAWSVRILIVFYAILAVLATAAIWLMTNETKFLIAYKIWYAFLWGNAIFTLYLTIVSGYIGFRKLRNIPAGVDARKKRNQLIRLFIMNLILFLYYALDGFGIIYNTYVQYSGYVLLFCWFAVAAWPRALANYHLKPGDVSPPDSHGNSMVDAAHLDTSMAQASEELVLDMIEVDICDNQGPETTAAHGHAAAKTAS